MFDEEEYYEVLSFIRKKRKKKISFDLLKNMGSDDELFASYIRYEDWPEDSQTRWMDLVLYIESKENELRSIQERVDRSTVVGNGVINDLEIPTDELSNWQLYRQKLIGDKFTNIDTIQVECKKVLSHLSLDTEPDNPVKGMVVGYVQSGKTANMAGLMSMAADNGFNFFIVLSGTIDNLRIQTRDRLYRDLYYENCNNFWYSINHLSLDNRDADMIRADYKVLTVCLKNVTRLRNLINWINSDLERKKNLRVMVIDDEADQGTINTARLDENRTKINDLIMKLVNCQDIDGNVTGRYGSMNYIQYTATPYANFLSENAPKSLFPKDFVVLLTPSDEYFGPYVIYGDGGEYPGLDIVDTSEDVDVISKNFIVSDNATIPEGLRDAVAWFVCCVCVVRHWGRTKPVSMLVHTTQFVKGHKKMGEAVVSCLGDTEDLIKRCRDVYLRKTSELTKDDFCSRFEKYGLGPETVNDYPDYSEIEESVSELIGMQPVHIGIDGDQKIIYKRSIHVCIDNARQDDIGICDEADESVIKRIIYPKDKDNVDFATAFIVIGGNTLSRGLTIEGLVSTYFGRASESGDTLMQMGRWFGFRKGYELLPRMWMSEESLLDFETVSNADNALRQFIKENYSRYTPSELPPMVNTFPKSGHLKCMTPLSKRRGAKLVNYDFSGCIFQTNVFDRNTDVLRHNENLVHSFLSDYSDKLECSDVSKSARVIRGVSTNDVCNGFISKFVYNDRLSKFKEIEELIEWIKDHASADWNIILGSRIDDRYGSWSPFEGTSINRIYRSPKHPEKTNGLDIVINKTLASPEDRYADVRRDDFRSDDYDWDYLVSNNLVTEIRDCCDALDVPVLIIYCISGESFGVDSDVFGITIQMPGVKSGKNTAKAFQLPIRVEE